MSTVPTPATGRSTDVELRLTPGPATPAAARRAGRQTLADWAAPEGVVEAVVLIVSELVTSGIVHGDAPLDWQARLTIRMHLGERFLTVAVTEGHTIGDTPAEGRPAPDDEHGRGLAIVTALASDHGYSTGPDHTTAWAQLPLAA